MEYVSQVTLDVNGQIIQDFKTVTEKEFELNKQVNLMNTTGYMSTTPRYGCEVEYVVPKGGEFDWSQVMGGRLTIDRQDGTRITYTGVYILKVGALKYDGDNEPTKTIDLGATGRVEE